MTVILLVEDEPPNRALAQAVLGRAAGVLDGAPLVLEAPRLSSARAILSSRPVDLVLLDIRLPDGDGLSLARELRAWPDATRPAVIVLSASALPSDREAAIQAGAGRFIAKPFAVAELTGAIVELLRTRPGGPGRAARSPAEQPGARSVAEP